MVLELTDDARAEIARAWRSSQEPQERFAAAHGVTARTLRGWIKRWAPPQEAAPEVVREVIKSAIERLHAVLVDLDAALAGKFIPKPPPVDAVPSARRPSPGVNDGVADARGVRWDLGNLGGQ